MSVKYTAGLHSALLQTSVKVKYESQKRTQKCYVGGWEGLCFGFWFDLFVCFCLFWWVCLDETSGSTSTVLKIPFHRKQ